MVWPRSKRAGDVGATSNQLQKPSDSKKQLMIPKKPRKLANKNDVKKMTSCRKWTFKPQTSDFFRCIRSNVHRGVSARKNIVKTHLCAEDMPYGTHWQMTNPNIELQAADYDFRLIKQILSKNVVKIEKKLSLDHLINGTTVVTVSTQEKTKVRCKQSSRNTGTSVQSSHRCWTYLENDLMNMCSHSPITESTSLTLWS